MIRGPINNFNVKNILLFFSFNTYNLCISFILRHAIGAIESKCHD